MEYKIKEFDQLSNRELYEALQLRNDVFIVEQKCPYNDIDGKDFKSIHLLAEDNNKLTAYLRIIPKGLSYPQASIGRVLVRKENRGQGLARDILVKAIQFITKEWNEKEIKIGAQLYLKSFYKSLGFIEVSEPYLEDDIPHIDMVYHHKL